MVKINLLPIYILERSRVRRIAVVVGLLLVLQIIALLLAVMHAKAKVAMEQDRAKYWGDVAAAVDEVGKMTQGRKTDVVPYQQWVNWVDSQKVYNNRVADLLQYMAHFVHAKVVLREFSWGGARISFSGATDSLATVRQFYMNMLRCPIVATVQLQVQVPGWTPTQLTPLQRPGAPGTYPALGTRTMPVSPQGTGYGPAQYRASAVRQVNPKESVPVTLQMTLRPEYIPVPTPPPASASQTTGGTVASPASSVRQVWR
jgi:Tfp pilus assembly protein PilN